MNSLIFKQDLLIFKVAYRHILVITMLIFQRSQKLLHVACEKSLVFIFSVLQKLPLNHWESQCMIWHFLSYPDASICFSVRQCIWKRENYSTRKVQLTTVALIHNTYIQSLSKKTNYPWLRISLVLLLYTKVRFRLWAFFSF